MQHVDEANASKNFTFKCHRDNAVRCTLLANPPLAPGPPESRRGAILQDIYSVNSCTFHPVQPTFVTTGALGLCN